MPQAVRIRARYILVEYIRKHHTDMGFAHAGDVSDGTIRAESSNKYVSCDCEMDWLALCQLVVRAMQFPSQCEVRTTG
jgi:hypothetical protein